ncbi:YpiF family protein [Alteribacillus sp. HJP-4]|uniref:YpiF family protein n=1 Tax=Alteribacillus sp. HJP-4 TaxID=2775394 RepID=UPI0035CCF27C
MKWIPNDIAQYEQEKAYIDTALVPLLALDFHNDIKHTAAMAEFTSLMTGEVEKQFRGRMLLTPPFTYLKNNDFNDNLTSLKEWLSSMKDSGIKHVVFITSDPLWKKAEAEIDELLLWMPLVPFENMDTSYKRQIISEQIKQILPLLLDKWKNE